MSKVTVRAGSNIAFVKYWGVTNGELNLPQSNSISMTLADAYTITTVEWDVAGLLTEDEIVLDGVRLRSSAAHRLVQHLERIRGLAGVDQRARVVSQNNFPMASGIASSASGFAALTVAGCRGLGLDLDETRLSALARRGSGSASRSIMGGFVEWVQGRDDATSVAHQLYGPTHWALYDVVAVVSRAAKQISSAGGHRLAATSPLNRGRIETIGYALEETRCALHARDLDRLGRVIERDALAMHGVMMTSTPPLFYWEPATITLIQAVQRWRREDGLAVYFTIDAGPNVHLICEADQVAAVQHRLNTLTCIDEIIVSKPGPGVQELAEHLF